MVDNLKEKQMSTQNCLKYFVRELENKNEQADKALEEFKKELDKDASYAFSWGGNAMMYAANKKINGQVLAHIIKMKEQGQDDATILRNLQGAIAAETLRAARWPERSTSPISNIMSQEHGMVYAELLSKLNDYIAVM
jgi:hypothetical protein